MVCLFSHLSSGYPIDLRWIYVPGHISTISVFVQRTGKEKRVIGLNSFVSQSGLIIFLIFPLSPIHFPYVIVFSFCLIDACTLLITRTSILGWCHPSCTFTHTLNILKASQSSSLYPRLDLLGQYSFSTLLLSFWLSEPFNTCHLSARGLTSLSILLHQSVGCRVDLLITILRP